MTTDSEGQRDRAGAAEDPDGVYQATEAKMNLSKYPKYPKDPQIPQTP